MSEPTTLRDAIEAAIDDDSSTSAAPAAPVETPAEPVAESAAPVAPEPTETPPEPTEAKADRHRAPDGKFAPKPAEEPKTDAPAEAAAITPGPKAEPAKDRAPVSWRPDVREHWNKLPPDVKAEVARRETEMQRTLQETAEARKYADAINKVIAPYEMFIRAENSNPLQAIDNMMATAARLRTAPAPDTAGLIASLVKQFGVGRFGNSFIEQLDSALAGEVPQQNAGQAQIQQAIQQQLAPMQQFMSQYQQAQAAQQQRLAQEAQSEVATFISQAEFGNDVREEMADLLEVAQRRGRALSLQEAYQQACVANPRVRAVLEQRTKANAAQQLTGAAQRAKAAAVSVSGAPALAAPATTPDSVRAAIEAAIAANSR